MLTETVPQASRVLFHPAQWKSLSISILRISKAQRSWNFPDWLVIGNSFSPDLTSGSMLLNYIILLPKTCLN